MSKVLKGTMLLAVAAAIAAPMAQADAYRMNPWKDTGVLKMNPFKDTCSQRMNPWKCTVRINPWKSGDVSRMNPWKVGRMAPWASRGRAAF